MEGTKGSNNGFDVTRSLPLGGERSKAAFLGANITHEDVTQSLRSHLKPAPFNRKTLDKFKVTHSLDPDIQLSAKFAEIEDKNLDNEGSVFFSLTNVPEEMEETEGGTDNVGNIDVMESLPATALRSLSQQKPDESLLPGSLTLPENNLFVDEPESEDEDDDLMFKSASNVMFGDRPDDESELKTQLEMNVAMSLMPTDEIRLGKHPRIDRAWEQLNSLIVQSGNSEAVNDALYQLVSLYPAVANPEKVADMLKTQIDQAPSSQDAITHCQQLMSKFQLADEVKEGDLTPLDQLPDDDAIQTLLIMRQKAVSESVPVDLLEKAIQERLMKAHGEKIEAFIGLNTDEKNPDYEHYMQLQETLGTVSLAEPVWSGKSSYVDKKRDIPIDPNFQHENPTISDQPVVSRTVEGAVARRLLEQVTDKPDDPLSELVKLDSWLADDPTQENVVTNLISRQVADQLEKKATALGLYSEQEVTPASSPVNPESEKMVEPGTRKRVRFSDQPNVGPRDNDDASRQGEKSAQKVQDIVDLSRNPASFEIRMYVERLSVYMQRLEVEAQKAMQHAKNSGGTMTDEGKAVCDKIQKYRSFAEKYRVHTQKISNLQAQYLGQLEQGYDPESQSMQQLKEKIDNGSATAKKGRMEVLAALDKEFDEHDRQPGAQARRQRVRELPFIKAGLVNEEKFLEFHEDQLAQMVMKTIDVRHSKATGRETYKLVPSDRLDSGGKGYKVEPFEEENIPPSYLVPRRRLRGLPVTSDIMTAVGKSSRPYHQAMEINLEDPVSFCAELPGITDPRVMLALRVRMENEQCPASMQSNWEKRMKDVMCGYQARQILFCLNSSVTAELKKKFAFNRKKVPIDQDAHDDYAAKRTVVYAERMIQEIQDGQMSYPGITKGANQSMVKVWDDLVKPANFPADVNELLVKYLPAPDELLRQLETEGLIRRAPKPVVVQEQPVSGATKAPEKEQSTWEWLVNWWSS